MQYLLDTNICVYLMREQPPSVARRCAAVMSACPSSRSRNCDMGWKRGLPIGSAMSARWQRCSPRFLQSPSTLGRRRPTVLFRAATPDRKRDALDRLIAAHAVAAGLTLVTNKVADFEGYPGLRLENWIS
jgi:tRNA(fMet)-specific endonuclease VapC